MATRSNSLKFTKKKRYRTPSHSRLIRKCSQRKKYKRRSFSSHSSTSSYKKYNYKNKKVLQIHKN